MAKWVECHSKSDKAVSVYVNLDLIASIYPASWGSRLAYAGDDESVIDVAESPEEVLSLLSVSS